MAGRGPRRVVVPLLALGMMGLSAAVWLFATARSAFAQSASAAPLPTPFDPRGGGTEPGLVGAPLLAALAVIALGIAAALATALYVRLAQRR